ncbi:MAG: hypothetical protein ABSA18_05835, partial [Dehalococcoidia bacterium]
MLYTVAMRIKVRPVGTVENGITQNHRFDAQGTVSRIILAPRYGRALDGIESFSHVVILFWLHKIKNNEREVLKVHPRR